MQDEHSEETDEGVEQTDEAVEPTAEDADTAEAVDTQAAQGGAGETVLRQPEVPDDANDTIAAAQEHINKLNMEKEREAAERAQKQL